MPAIRSDVPIGYRINGDEMLSFIPAIQRKGGRSFPIARSRLRKLEREQFPPSPKTEGSRPELSAYLLFDSEPTSLVSSMADLPSVGSVNEQQLGNRDNIQPFLPVSVGKDGRYRSHSNGRAADQNVLAFTRAYAKSHGDSEQEGGERKVINIQNRSAAPLR